MLIARGSDNLATAVTKLSAAPELQLSSVKSGPSVAHPEKVICMGLNYRDHSAESSFEQPEFPTLFGHFNSSLIEASRPDPAPAAVRVIGL
jgi:acylpyruvate hydrolase